MPQADLFFSAELKLDSASLLAEIESTIAAHDSSAGECKGRAHPVETTHRRHALLQVALLEKPHRNPEFMLELRDKLSKTVSSKAPSPCIVSIELRFQTPFSSTVKLESE
ncbi:MAG: hypothetical protein AAFY60_17215 [Myxococcota bacterium]